MTDLEKLLLGGMGAGVIGLAGFAARILWVILPRYLEQNERNTQALQWISYSIGQLPTALKQQQDQLERVLTQSLEALRNAFREEHARTRADLTGQVNELSERIERRISGQEDALKDTQLELVRSGSIPGKTQVVLPEEPEVILPPPPSKQRGHQHAGSPR